MTDRPRRLPHLPPLRALFSWAITLVWAGLIYDLSSETFGSSLSAWVLGQILDLLGLKVSPENFATLHFYFRKLAHLTEYAIFTLLLYVSLEGGRAPSWRPRTALICVLAAAGYALTDEFHQLFVPGRTGSVIDCGIDATGASLGMLVVYANGKIVQARSKSPAAAQARAAEK